MIDAENSARYQEGLADAAQFLIKLKEINKDNHEDDPICQFIDSAVSEIVFHTEEFVSEKIKIKYGLPNLNQYLTDFYMERRGFYGNLYAETSILRMEILELRKKKIVIVLNDMLLKADSLYQEILDAIEENDKKIANI